MRFNISARRADVCNMRIRVAALAVAVLLSGCGHDPPPGATSRGLVAKVVLDWDRARAGGDGEPGCRLLTQAQQAAIVRSGRRLAAIGGTRSPASCVEAVTFMGPAPEVLLFTRVDAVRISGERATATARTTALSNGLRGQGPPVNITLRWSDGHWLIERRTVCRLGDLLDRVVGESSERKRAAQSSCTT